MNLNSIQYQILKNIYCETEGLTEPFYAPRVKIYVNLEQASSEEEQSALMFLCKHQLIQNLASMGYYPTALGIDTYEALHPNNELQQKRALIFKEIYRQCNTPLKSLKIKCIEASANAWSIDRSACFSFLNYLKQKSYIELHPNGLLNITYKGIRSYENMKRDVDI